MTGEGATPQGPGSHVLCGRNSGRGAAAGTGGTRLSACRVAGGTAGGRAQGWLAPQCVSARALGRTIERLCVRMWNPYNGGRETPGPQSTRGARHSPRAGDRLGRGGASSPSHPPSSSPPQGRPLYQSDVNVAQRHPEFRGTQSDVYQAPGSPTAQSSGHVKSPARCVCVQRGPGRLGLRCPRRRPPAHEHLPGPRSVATSRIAVTANVG